jgi:hypothetical protein
VPVPFPMPSGCEASVRRRLSGRCREGHALSGLRTPEPSDAAHSGQGTFTPRNRQRRDKYYYGSGVRSGLWRRACASWAFRAVLEYSPDCKSAPRAHGERRLPAAPTLRCVVGHQPLHGYARRAAFRRGARVALLIVMPPSPAVEAAMDLAVIAAERAFTAWCAGHVISSSVTNLQRVNCECSVVDARPA